jgi:hypothetical protein
MKGTRRSASGWMVSAIVTVLASWLLALPLQVNGQNTCSGSQGQNGVYNATCNNNAPGVVGSNAFIDASMFGNNSTDICAVLYGILKNIVPTTTGAVIDARGLPGSTGTSMTCATGTTPWNNGTTYVAVPSTILLPAGTIQIPATWVLPNNTRLVGEGENNPLSSTPGTTIQAAVPSLPSMIQFGPSSSACTSSGCSGISVERLTLDGRSQSIDGIINQLSQNNTYVDHVTLYQILGTGLLVSSTTGGSASNSGPYTNITFDTGGYSGTTSTVCAQISNNVSGGNLTGTKGIHGLRCTSETNDAPAAVLLDASNNSIEDVKIVGFYDGVLVGANATPPQQPLRMGHPQPIKA